jgi:hypothetical protein
VVLIGGETTHEVRFGADISVLDNASAFSIAGPTASSLSVNAQDVSLDASNDVNLNAGDGAVIGIGMDETTAQSVTLGSTNASTSVTLKAGTYSAVADATGIELSGASSSVKYTDSLLSVDVPSNFSEDVTLQTSLFFDSSEASQILPLFKSDADGSGLTVSAGSSDHTDSTGGSLKLEAGSGDSQAGNVAIGQSNTHEVLVGSASVSSISAVATEVSVDLRWVVLSAVKSG